jgi:hypothetical protein
MLDEEVEEAGFVIGEERGEDGGEMGRYEVGAFGVRGEGEGFLGEGHCCFWFCFLVWFG